MAHYKKGFSGKGFRQIMLFNFNSLPDGKILDWSKLKAFA